MMIFRHSLVQIICDIKQFNFSWLSKYFSVICMPLLPDINNRKKKTLILIINLFLYLGVLVSLNYSHSIWSLTLFTTNSYVNQANLFIRVAGKLFNWKSSLPLRYSNIKFIFVLCWLRSSYFFFIWTEGKRNEHFCVLSNI